MCGFNEAGCRGGGLKMGLLLQGVYSGVIPLEHEIYHHPPSASRRVVPPSGSSTSVTSMEPEMEQLCLCPFARSQGPGQASLRLTALPSSLNAPGYG